MLNFSQHFFYLILFIYLLFFLESSERHFDLVASKIGLEQTKFFVTKNIKISTNIKSLLETNIKKNHKIVLGIFWDHKSFWRGDRGSAICSMSKGDYITLVHGTQKCGYMCRGIICMSAQFVLVSCYNNKHSHIFSIYNFVIEGLQAKVASLKLRIEIIYSSCHA